MRQSTIIFGTLLFSFIVYITLRGQMPEYLGLFTAKAKSAQSAATTPQSSGSSGGGKSAIELADSAIQTGQRLSNMFNLGFG